MMPGLVPGVDGNASLLEKRTIMSGSMSSRRLVKASPHGTENIVTYTWRQDGDSQR